MQIKINFINETGEGCPRNEIFEQTKIISLTNRERVSKEGITSANQKNFNKETGKMCPKNELLVGNKIISLTKQGKGVRGMNY